ncbi:MAG TPA: SpaA isopeptide-forming pilin-related protein [Acidimicrobiales bacterium]|nr:SpaA isopeptide-forming pilin-related protein [Acidimicrobiales bacterium]
MPRHRSPNPHRPPRRQRLRTDRRGLAAVGAVLVVLGAATGAVGVTQMLAPVGPAAASNGYGPGIGPQSPTQHWGGAYVLTGVPGYAYCIDPGTASPTELPTTHWSPIPYPGSGVYSNGQMAALAYFAERYQGTGWNGYPVNTTVAAIAQIAYTSSGGTTPPSSRAPAALVAQITAWMTTYAGPWTISLTMTPPSGSVFAVGRNYSGTITVRSATGAGVGGLQLTAPPTGGPGANQISNFVWLAGTTNAAGQLSFVWNISGVPPALGGLFSAQNINVVGDAVGTAPPAYGAPGGSGGQAMMVSGASEVLGTSFGGLATTTSTATGRISISKAVNDGAYYGPGGAVFQIKDGFGHVLETLTTNSTGNAGPSITLTATTTGVQYAVVEVTAPPGYQLAPPMVVSVYPNQTTVASFTGPNAEFITPAQLGAAKIDAETSQPLAGATFDFKYSTTNNGIYDQDLGICTTTTAGTCQPPTQNTSGGWLAGWYQVTETAAPPGYWLNPATVQTVFISPGASAVASVTFADQFLGSLRLTKSGNDTAYWAVAGAVFTVTGPAPSTTTVGALTVGATGTTNTLTGLVPGTYTLTETAVPPGYSAVTSFSVAVTAGHTTMTASAADAIQPGSLIVSKTDAATGDALPGATFDVRYDPTGSGTYSVDLGPCTTGVTGTCSPAPNDGTGFLPGNYQVTETAAPTGYFLPTPAPTQTVTVDPAAVATVSFTDPLLVPASFHKVATGSVNPTQLVLAGAVIDVTAGTSYGGPVVATCTTDANGNCTTASVLISGQPYCWLEASAPSGLAAGATGCFVATNTQGAEPITVTDPGEFVAVAAKKVDAANPTFILTGATFDLYRVDGGTGPNGPTPPADAAVEPGQTWVARATTDAAGIAAFPLQLPDYAYCVVEHQAPANYVLDTTEHCTTVLDGTTTTPAPVTTVTVDDAEAEASVAAHKFNSATPGTGIPGAVYDLYVVGAGPPSGPPGPAPTGAVTEPGDTWWARGATGDDGSLVFTVPAGYRWCFREAAAPVDYSLDPAVHCTAVITTATATGTSSVALPETLAMVEVYAHKFNSTTPATFVPGASYELVGQGAVPPGWSPADNPNGYPVPPGDWYYGAATTDDQGDASWSVPAGSSWCMHEVSVPSGYEPDPAWHCTAVITTATGASAATMALPETPVPAPTLPPSLPYTGDPALWQAALGGAFVLSGSALTFMTRRRKSQAEG